jgi:hypothetical protein
MRIIIVFFGGYVYLRLLNFNNITKLTKKLANISQKIIKVMLILCKYLLFKVMLVHGKANRAWKVPVKLVK